MAPHSSTLTWKIPWMEAPGRLQSMSTVITLALGSPLQCLTYAPCCWVFLSCCSFFLFSFTSLLQVLAPQETGK